MTHPRIDLSTPICDGNHPWDEICSDKAKINRSTTMDRKKTIKLSWEENTPTENALFHDSRLGLISKIHDGGK